MASIALFALAACSATELKPVQPLKAGSDEGVVILSVMRSGERNFDMFLWLDGPGQWVPRPIALFAHSNARDWRGGDARDWTPADNPEGRLVVLKLPAGKYQIAEWNGQSETGGFFDDGFDIGTGKVNISFTVEPGKVSYLGSIHIRLPRELNYQANLMHATYRLTIDNQRKRDLAMAKARFSDWPGDDAVATVPVQFPKADHDIRYYVYNRQVGSSDHDH